MNDNNIWLEYIKNIKKIKNYKTKVIAQYNNKRNLQINSKDFTNKAPTTIDLHGLTQNQAFENLKNFLHLAFLHNQKELLIITGKGSPSKPSVIKLEVPRWLQYTELNEYIGSVGKVRYFH